MQQIRPEYKGLVALIDYNIHSLPDMVHIEVNNVTMVPAHGVLSASKVKRRPWLLLDDKPHQINVGARGTKPLQLFCAVHLHPTRL